jgi:hypothetical protein
MLFIALSPESQKKTPCGGGRGREESETTQEVGIDLTTTRVMAVSSTVSNTIDPLERSCATVDLPFFRQAKPSAFSFYGSNFPEKNRKLPRI